MASKALRDYYAKLARLGCVCCTHLGFEGYDGGVEIHHIRRFGGKRDNADAVPLCAFHHRLGDTSIHQLGAKGFRKQWGFDLEDKVLEVEAQLNAGS
jgi:hypothetical protein